ncbi:MAG: hypothetical protein QXZ25_06060 [Candidatus Bathyarchaeia archaeon]
MAESEGDLKGKLRQISFRVLRAAVKGIIFYVVYFVLSIFLAPISELFPGFKEAVEIIAIVYISLMIVGELTSGTIFQHFFNVAKELFVFGFLILSLESGVISVTYQQIKLTVDLRLFLIIAVFLSLLGLSKSILQTIDFLNEKAEQTTV